MPHPDAINPRYSIGSVTSCWSPVAPPWSVIYQPRYSVHSDHVRLIPRQSVASTRSNLAFVTQGPARRSFDSFDTSQRGRFRRGICCSLPETTAGRNSEEAVTELEAHNVEPIQQTGTHTRPTRRRAALRQKERKIPHQISGLMRRIIKAGKDGRYCSVPINAVTGVSFGGFLYPDLLTNGRQRFEIYGLS